MNIKCLGAGLAAISLAVALLASPAAAGARNNTNVLRVDDLQAVTFAGEVSQNEAPGPAAVDECATVNCDHYRLKVDLPRAAWILNGGVQVTVAWTGLFNDIAGLAVYRDGMRVGLSDAFVSTFQSVRINPPGSPDKTPNGWYDVYVAYNSYPLLDDVTGELIQNPTPVLAYEGWVEPQYNTPNFPRGRDLLPNLKPIAPGIATFNSPAPIFGDRANADHPSCFNSEVEEQGATVCLRIEQRMWNVNGYNSGPVEVRFSKPAGEFPDELPATQRIYKSDGTFRDVLAGTVHFHPIHGHYHFTDFTQTSLYAIGPDGATVPGALRMGIKNGFCMADTDVIARQNSHFVAPMVYSAPNCLEPRSINPDGTELFIEGQGSGNGDTYGWDLPDQYVPAAGLTDGTYVAQTVVDPEQKLIEVDRSDNCIAVVIQLTGMGTATPHAEIVPGLQPACV